MEYPTMWLIGLIAAANVASAQSFMAVDGPNQLHGRGAAYDTIRQRLVTLDSHGVTSELLGGRLVRRPPAHVPRGPAVMGYDPVRRETVLLDSPATGPATWTYDGAQWRQKSSGAIPSISGHAVMAFDEARGVLVLLGGRTSIETWSWNGQDWSHLTPRNSPPFYAQPAMAYDPRRGVIVLCTGTLPATSVQTWEWDGTDWLQRTLPLQPPARSSHAMAYDALRDRMVLFGGDQNPRPGERSDDVWEFDGAVWIRVPGGPGSPPPLSAAPCYFDEVLGEVCLLGGRNGTLWAQQSFTWNGTRWQTVTPSPLQQSPQRDLAMTEDPASDALLGIAGTNGSGNLDIWQWNAGRWTQLTAPAPPNRAAPSAWSDLQHAYVFGGFLNTGGRFPVTTLLDDTWKWDGANWTQVALLNRPPGRAGSPIAYDPLRNEAVMFSGNFVPALNDTWTFDGANWRQANPSISPIGRHGHALCFDYHSGHVVLFGGQRYPGALSDTWEWDGTNWQTMQPNPRPPLLGGASIALEHDWRLGRLVLITTSLAPQTSTAISPLQAWTYHQTSWQPIALSTQTNSGTTFSAASAIGGAVHLYDGHSLFALVAEEPRAEFVGDDCGAHAPMLAARALPRLGDAEFGLEVMNLAPNEFSAIIGSVSTASAVIAGCPLHVTLGQSTVIARADGRGLAEWRAPIGADPRLLGLAVTFQAFTLGPRASRGLRVTIGSY